MAALLRRLLASSIAYQTPGIVASLLALVTLPLYTKYLSAAELGYAETLLTAIILTSIVLRAGVGEAFVRFWFDAPDAAGRRALAHTVIAWTVYATTAVAVVGLVFAGPLSQALLNVHDATLMACGVLGLWAFTNLEIANALLRVQERRRVYVIASLSNVLLTVALTVVLVVVMHKGARGYVLGNYAASTIVLLGLWIVERHHVSLRPPRGLRPLLAFGAPTIPADAAIFALNVVDRSYLLHTQSAAMAGQYALAAKLSTVVIVAVRGFQAAWPPLAYSVSDEAEAARLYARVTRAYVAFTGLVVGGVALVGPWAVRVLSSRPEYLPAMDALPWVALGWAMYGLVLVLITVAGRAKITTRNFPAAAVGLAVNVALLVALVEPLGIAGAGIALAGAYVVMLAVLHGLTRRLFVVPYEWAKLGAAVAITGGVAVAGLLAFPDHGLGALGVRFALGAFVAPALLAAARVITPAELRALTGGRRRASQPARPTAAVRRG